MAKDANNNEVIPAGLRADIMRKKMESKDTLTAKGSLYVGTGISETENGVTTFKTNELRVGTDNQVLACDSAEGNGVAWKTINSNLFLHDIDLQQIITSSQGIISQSLQCKYISSSAEPLSKAGALNIVAGGLVYGLVYALRYTATSSAIANDNYTVLHILGVADKPTSGIQFKGVVYRDSNNALEVTNLVTWVYANTTINDSVSPFVVVGSNE